MSRRFLGLFLSKSWGGPIPLFVVGVLLGEAVLWALLALLRIASFGIVLYLAPWMAIGCGAIAWADRSPDQQGTVSFVAAVLTLSLVEEALAFEVGGGLGGHATSLLDDWVRSVPSFVGLGLGALAAHRIEGSTARDRFLGGAVAGLLMEIVIGRSGQPLAFLAFGGIAAWTYGIMAGFPLLPEREPVEKVWLRFAMATLLAALGVLAGNVVGLLLAPPYGG